MPFKFGDHTGLADIMTPKKSHKVQEISHKVLNLKGDKYGIFF